MGNIISSIDLHRMHSSSVRAQDRVEDARVKLLGLTLHKNDREVIKRIQRQYHLDGVSEAGTEMFVHQGQDYRFMLDYSNYMCRLYEVEGVPEKYEFYFNELDG